MVFISFYGGLFKWDQKKTEWILICLDDLFKLNFVDGIHLRGPLLVAEFFVDKFSLISILTPN